MNFDFNLEDYADECYVMHCETEEEADEFLRYLHDNGRRWNNGQSYLVNNNWNRYRNKTCYQFNSGQFSGYDFFRSDNYFTILEYSDFISEDEEKLEPMTFEEICSALGCNIKNK